MKKWIILGLMVGIMLKGNMGAQEKKVEEKGLVARWNFNEGKGSTVQDVSGNKSNGEIEGEPKWVKGILGSGLDFNGEGDYVDFGAEPKLNLTDAITVEVWVYPRFNAYGDRGIIGNVLYANGYKGGFGLLEWSIKDTDNHYWYVMLANQDGKILYTGSAIDIIELEKWQFVVFTYDNNELQLYVNGEFITKNTGKRLLSLPKDSNNLVIAKHPYGKNYFNGIIDEVKIYNRALNKEEIKAHYYDKAPKKGKKEYKPMKVAGFLKGKEFNLNIGESGGIELEIEGDRYFLNSSFSYPYLQIGYNFLSVEKQTNESGWQPRIKQVSSEQIEISSEGEHYSLLRKIILKGERIEVDDTLKNKTNQPVGIIVSHQLIPSEISLFRVAGIEEGRNFSGIAENPTIFIVQDKSSLGFIAEDNILRLQGEVQKKEEVFNYLTRHFALDKSKEYTFSFSLYPLKTKEYFAFINKVRHNWDVNFTIEGPFLFGDGRYGSYKHIQGRKAKIYCNYSPWFEYYSINPTTGKIYTREEQKTNKKTIEQIKSLQPDAICLPQVETNLFAINTKEIPGGEILPVGTMGTQERKGYGLALNEEQSKVLEAVIGEWKDSLLRTEDGRIIVDIFYAKAPYLDLMAYPQEGNYRYKHFLNQIDFLMNEVGWDGIYIDQFTLASEKYGRTYDKWDSWTVDIDEQTGLITKKYTNCSLVGATARKKIVEYIISKGGTVVANGFPVTREEQNLRAFRFVEAEGGFNPLTFMNEKPPLTMRHAKGHLASPIALGYRPSVLKEEGTGKHAEIIIKSVVTALRNGLLYYYYTSTIPETGPGSGEYGPINHMFPFTPVELNEGYLIGKERIITCVSKTFLWDNPKEPICYLFDLKGIEKKNNFKITKKENRWEVEIKLNDWNEIAVIE